ncbi:MAG TPA: ribonuclease III [Rickettsiales bacterium]|nr:ribonuclease III [Rickettsiales bacterium]
MSIETIIGYEFADKQLLLEALTHPGCAEVRGNQPFNYQRLEFLGDSVLGVVVAELLFTLYPQENEGNLAKRHAALVRSESLAGVARKLGIADYIRMSVGGRGGEKRDNNSNLEDVCEALIGALYLDGGFEVARGFILNHWKDIAKSMGEPPKDAKTSLQEWAQGRGLKLPVYTVIEVSGSSHAPQFTVEASVESGGRAVAKAPAKRQAEQLAAKALLERLEK